MSTKPNQPIDPNQSDRNYREAMEYAATEFLDFRYLKVDLYSLTGGDPFAEGVKHEIALWGDETADVRLVKGRFLPTQTQENDAYEDNQPKTKNTIEELYKTRAGRYLGMHALRAHFTKSIFENYESDGPLREMYDSSRSNLKAELQTLRETFIERSSSLGVTTMVDKYPIPDELRNKLTSNPNRSVFDGLIAADNDTLVEFLLWNKDYQDEQTKKYDFEGGVNSDGELVGEGSPETAEHIIDFIDAMDKAINKHGLPLTKAQLFERLAKINIMSQDPLVGRLEQVGGFYHLRESEISIFGREDKLLNKAVIFHELLHQVSGQLALEIIFTDNSAKDTYINHHPLSDGLCLYGRPNWLNEAVTEQLAQILLTDKAGDWHFQDMTGIDIALGEESRAGTYWGYRMLLSTLMYSSRINFDTFLKAYFEEPSESLEERSHLYSKITASFYSNLFSFEQSEKLDEMGLRGQIDALEHLKSLMLTDKIIH